MALLAFIPEFAKSLLEPPQVTVMLLLQMTQELDIHIQTCRQTLLSTRSFPHEAEPQRPDCLVTLIPLHMSS